MMKRLFLMMLAILFLLPEVTVEAQSRQMRRELRKEYSKKKKQLKKEGWQLYGSSRTLDVVLLKHYERLNELDGKGYELMGEMSACKSMNIGVQAAINNACDKYARMASVVRGRILSDIGANADDIQAEFDHFYAAYETLVKKEIKGELIESFTLYKINPDGTNKVQVFFIVDEESAAKARIRAFQNALEESEVAQKYAEKISKFIQEGFDAYSEK